MKAHRRRGLLPSAAPPPKILEAVERGLHPLMLGVQTHKAESTARERAKKRRRGLETDAPPRSQTSSGRSASASSSPQSASCQSRNSSTSAKAVPAANTHLPAVPTARAIQRTREGAVSATLTSRYGELRAKRQEEEEYVEKRKRSRSSAAPLQDRAAESAGSDRGKGTHKCGRAEEKQLPRQDFPFQASTAATASRSRTDVWRRRCTKRKIQRLSCRVTRAAALRRYWYTAFSGIEAGALAQAASSPVAYAVPASGAVAEDGREGAATAARAPQPMLTQGELEIAPPLTSVFGSNNPTEKRCALRRLRAARRSANGVQCGTKMTRKQGGAAGVAEGAASKVETGQHRAATVISAADRTALSHKSRRQRKKLIRRVLSSSATRMWTLAGCVVAERVHTVAQLRLECTGATALASGLATSTHSAGALPLALARLFTLFGALVEVQELELTTAPAQLRSSRHARRSHFTSADSDESARDTPQLRVLQQRKGVVMEEYSTALGVLLLPSQNGADAQAWAHGVTEMCAHRRGTLTCGKDDAAAPFARMISSPSIVRVPKHFPGASGSFAELVQLLLLRARTAHSTSHGGRGSAFTTSTAARAPGAHAAGLHVLAAVFCGEVHTAAEDCDVAACDARGNEEGPPVIAEDIMATAYPLHRLLHRCL
ncbi:hypothetical protein LSCM1_02532 [Leishmania martiniquensis]|uniref:Uncharacterized protein n=1 Tax=Leishmania martiniquensis TaxID=1580590 RepID=A0A836FU23_9TRYP|nr:hypothetical protein LSCM1_02532 [Leishmania martiniquensis]